MHFQMQLITPPFHINCRCGIFVYQENHNQPFVLVTINDYEMMFFMN